jgi:DnaK suppressor protein
MPTTTQTPSSGATKRDPKLANAWKTKSAEELTDAEVLAMSDDDYMNESRWRSSA